MKKKVIYVLSLMAVAGTFSACSSDSSVAPDDTAKEVALKITSDIVPMQGDAVTRVNDAGDSFESGDVIRLKLITPYVNMGETGSHTWESTDDNFYLLSWQGASSNWGTSLAGKNFDINGDGNAESSGPGLTYLPQQTPYVFTANTFSECRGYMITSSKYWVEYRNVFYADQSTQSNYHSSDLLWAQTIMQTGTENVRLSFSHVMSCLEVTIANNSGTDLTSPVVTLEGVPDIDRGEVVVGNQYANKDVNYIAGVKYGYGYVSYVSDAGDNGKAIGLAELSSDGTTMSCVRFADIDKTGTYTGYKYADNVYRFIVPPFTGSGVKVWLRDGARRYSISLGDNFTFAPSTCHQVKLTIPATSNP
jgi:hypothetical protein